MNLPSSAAPAHLASSRAHLSMLDHIQIASLWFAFFAQWMTVVPVLVPAQVSQMVGHDAAFKEGIAGSVVAAGAFIALIVAPLSGALSDRSRAKAGRRRPFLVSGVIGMCVALVWLASFGRGSSLWLYTFAFLLLQFCWNWAAGPYAGLVPDVVPEADTHRASAWLNVMTILGTIAGNALLFALHSPGRLYPVAAAFSAIALVCLALTLRGAKEPVPSGTAEPFEMRAFIRSFYIDPRWHPNFYWVLITRLFGNMGVWSIFTFMLYYLQDAIGIRQPGPILNLVLGVSAILAIPASLFGAWLAERQGTVQVVRLTSWIMAVAATIYVLLALHPDLRMVIPVALIFGAAYGAYQVVDWALALKVLPERKSAGKDMGIWHISMVLPQIVGPAATGWLISWIKVHTGPGPAYVTAFAIAAGWFAVSAWLVGRVRLGDNPNSQPG